MNKKRFEDLVLDQNAQAINLLREKSKEYATEDMLFNFKEAAKVGYVNPAEALLGMARKHYISIEMMSKEPFIFTEKQWNEKLLDIQNYMYLLKGVLEDMRLDQKNLDRNCTKPCD